MKMQKSAIFVEKNLKINKKYHKVRDHCHYTGVCRGTTHRICKLKYSRPIEITVIFHNGSNYDYHFIIKELPDESEGQLTCLRDNTEKYITFSVVIEKAVKRIVKTGEEIIKTISCKSKFIDSARFMAS